jgi:predicted permease
MSLMLLAAAFLMKRSFERDVVSISGFARTNLLLARFDPRLAQYDADQTAQFYRVLVDRARVLPGVKRVGLTQNPPLGLNGFTRIGFVPEGYQMPRDRESVMSRMDTVDEGYFETMGVAIVKGRGFLATDTADSPRVAIVNEQLAKHYWPNADPLGKQIRLENGSGPAVEIVGVAQTIRYEDSSNTPKDFLYMPLAQHPVAKMILLLEANGDPLQLVQPVKELVRSLNPNLPVLEMRTYEDVYRYSAVEGPGVAIQLVGTLGLVGLFLAVAGLYGVVAYNVSRRTREIGIRMAVGATPRDVLRLVLGKGFALVAAGAAIGLALGLAVERLMNAMIFDAGGVDLAAYAAVVPVLFLVAMIAAWVPARRASCIEPNQALRYE